jgi:CubicO group peptidase (beta-lactamase class C family)
MIVSRKLAAILGLLMLPCALHAAKAPKKPKQSETAQRIAGIIACLPTPVEVKGDTTPCPTLAEQMAELHVSGVSIAVEHNGVLEWAQGFGVVQFGGRPVTPSTLFQAGSISKPLAAMAALHLVQEGKLSLDRDINTQLTSWKVPLSSAAPGAVVTLRELLTHTAGFTVHGFPGYAAGAPVPTLVQVLDGAKPANTAPIRLEAMPGARWQYSGGGYEVMQQLLLDVAKEPFPRLLHDTVLAPIGMTHSTYDQPLPPSLQPDAATPHTIKGDPVPGGAHTYPEMAAAGLWTTPSDLVKYIIEVQRSLDGKANHVLDRKLTQQMLTAGKGNWGLGLEIGGAAEDPYFSHGGDNEGFESVFVGFEQNGDGAAVMTNAQGGMRVAEAVMRSIAVEYHWPDFYPIERAQVKVDPAILARYAGTYEFGPHIDLVFDVQNGQLMGGAPNGPKYALYPESQTTFFPTIFNAEFEFFPDDKGQVSYLIVHQEGHDTKAMRK